MVGGTPVGSTPGVQDYPPYPVIPAGFLAGIHRMERAKPTKTSSQIDTPSHDWSQLNCELRRLPLMLWVVFFLVKYYQNPCILALWGWRPRL